MAKKSKKNQDLKFNKVKKDSTFWISIFILIIMVASVVGFALSGTSSRSSSANSENIAFGQNFQNPETGELYWGARIKGQNFIFYGDIDSYEQSILESALANKLKNQKNVIKIYQDTNFTSNEAIFLIERGLNSLSIGTSKIDNLTSCDEQTLVFTQNTSFEGNCMKFISSNEDAQNKADIVLYHLIKTFTN